MAQNKKKHRKNTQNRPSAPKAAYREESTPVQPKKDSKKLIVRIGMIILALILAISAVAPIFLR